MSYTGKIIKGIAGFYYVDIKDKGLYECKAKGLFRKEGIKPLVGDNAVIDIIDEEKKTGNIIDITERKNSIIRPACANIDLAVTVMSASKPKFKPLLMDKILIFFEYYDIDTLICFNKVDDASEEDIEAIESHFSHTGYELLYTSAKTGTGVDKLKEILKGKTSILTGPSGVGKSSLINNIFPHADMETGGMSKIAVESIQQDILRYLRWTTIHLSWIHRDLHQWTYLISIKKMLRLIFRSLYDFSENADLTAVFT